MGNIPFVDFFFIQPGHNRFQHGWQCGWWHLTDVQHDLQWVIDHYLCQHQLSAAVCKSTILQVQGLHITVVFQLLERTRSLQRRQCWCCRWALTSSARAWYLYWRAWTLASAPNILCVTCVLITSSRPDLAEARLREHIYYI